jgi:hypothetical protein
MIEFRAAADCCCVYDVLALITILKLVDFVGDIVFLCPLISLAIHHSCRIRCVCLVIVIRISHLFSFIRSLLFQKLLFLSQ